MCIAGPQHETPHLRRPVPFETSKLWSHSLRPRGLAPFPFEVAGFSRVGAPFSYRVANWLACKFLKAMRQHTGNALRAKFTKSSIRSRESLGTPTSLASLFRLQERILYPSRAVASITAT